MHGRLKIKTTAEQQEEKRKEKEEKRKKYLKLFNLANEKNCQSTMPEFMKASEQVLMVNPDLSTFWNHRRRLLLSLTEDLEENLQYELDLTKTCLMANPKSYSAWHHRQWIMSNHPAPPWEKERQLCDDYLKQDERNFHCWDHRRFVVNGSKREADEELQVSKELIERNLSNYSAWHYRSKLLPVVHPPLPDTPHPLDEESLVKELKMVVEAVFTDPSDQSPWFFLRWLINRQRGPARVVQTCVAVNGCTSAEVTCVYSEEVTSDCSPKLAVDGMSPHVWGWVAPHMGGWAALSKSNTSCVWSMSIDIPSSLEHTIYMNFHGKNRVALTTMPTAKNKVFRKVISRTTADLSELTRSTLLEIKDNCVALDELEPNNKWVLLTLVDVMWALDYTGYKSSILGYLVQLEKLDPLRSSYYCDMRSKLLMKISLDHHINDEDLQKFSLPRSDLTRVYEAHHLACFASVDLSDNLLSSISPLYQLVSCNELILNNNTQITNISALSNLKSLVKLSLNNCGIESLSMIDHLHSLENLVELDLRNNPVSSNQENIDHIALQLSHIKCLQM